MILYFSYYASLDKQGNGSQRTYQQNMNQKRAKINLGKTNVIALPVHNTAQTNRGANT